MGVAELVPISVIVQKVFIDLIALTSPNAKVSGAQKRAKKKWEEKIKKIVYLQRISTNYIIFKNKSKIKAKLPRGL